MRNLLATFAFLSSTSVALASHAATVAEPMTQSTASSTSASTSRIGSSNGERFARTQRPTSTRDLAAQAEFDDGLTLLYAFNPEQARVSFTRALADDPSFALAWWGVAMTYGININTAFDPANQLAGATAIARAKRIAASATPVERALISAASARFMWTKARDDGRSARAYRDAMDVAAAAFPLDDDVATLAAEAEMDVHPWSFFNDDGTATPGTLGLIARLQQVLARSPDHIGANHLLLHALEESSHPGDALTAARTLAKLDFEPAAEHLIHMPSHIFMRVGDYHDAGIANARAIAAYEIYLANDPAGHKDYLTHDCTFGVDAFMMSGEEASARALIPTCDRDGEGFGAEIDVRFHRWDAIAHDAPGEYAQGALAAHDGRVSSANEHLASLRHLKSGVTNVEADVLEAEIARRAGANDTEIAALSRAVALQNAFGYSEPPQLFFPVGELLGAADLRAGRYADAERAFRDDLTHNPENPRSLFGLAAALAREQRSDEARGVRERANRAWLGAVPVDPTTF